MYYIHNNDAYETSARKLNLINMNFEKSSSLLKFMKKLKIMKKKFNFFLIQLTY